MKERSYWKSVEGRTGESESPTMDAKQVVVKQICESISDFDASEQNDIIKAVYHEIEDMRLRQIAQLKKKVAYLEKLNEEI